MDFFIQAQIAFIHLTDASCQAQGNSASVLDIVAGMSDSRKQAAKWLQFISKQAHVRLPHG